jgi:hypothetical protein
MVSPGRSWLLATDGLPTMPFLHSIRDTVIKDQRLRRDDGKRAAPKGQTLEKRMDAAEIQQQHMGLRPETVATSRKQEDIICEALGQTNELEVMKRAVRISVRLWKVSNWTLWRSQPL